MTKRAMQIGDREQWQRAASRMRTMFDLHYRNGSLYLNPWLRAAHSMYSAWRIRNSQRHLRKKKGNAEPPDNWTQALRLMKASFDRRAREQAMQGTWEYWASHRPPLTNRYIRQNRR